MKQLMVIDVDSCWGCKTCTVACKMHDGIPAGEISPISVFRIENTNDEGEVFCDFIPVACQHCNIPACIEACPVGAIKRNEAGLVIINKNSCIGCGKCSKNCPYGAIAIRKDNGGKRFAYKCDMCIERRALGGKTYCEQHCPGEVFHCLSEKDAELLACSKKFRFSVGQVIYVSDTLSNLGSIKENEKQNTEF